MPRSDELSLNATFDSTSILTGYGTSNAEGFDGQDVNEFLGLNIKVTAIVYNTTTNVIVLTLADGSQVVGTVTT